MTSNLGDRIKRYETAASHILTPRVPVMIRVDGRAFRTFTRTCAKPFDPAIVEAMVAAAAYTAKDMAGFRLAYVQSDEATFLIDDLATMWSKPWFDNKLHKLVSLSASLFTAAFNTVWPGEELATFDSRAFTIPRIDAPNAFIWRQCDWERNSLQMLARAHFTARELEKKNREQVLTMLQSRGVDPAELSAPLQNGTFILSSGELRCERADYETVDGWITEATARSGERKVRVSPAPGRLARSEAVGDDRVLRTLLFVQPSDGVAVRR